ncbi:MAG: cell division protein FtsZ [Bacteroidales bacterium]|nr:cell division protein FtsZ [Bacteroidales bacterium]
MTDLIKFDTKEERPNIIKVIGVGGGGSNAVTHMFTEGIQGVDFILCNTDYQALEKSPVAMKVHLGKRALGAGNKPDVGRDAALETTDELREILGEDTKMLFITAGMGGGTGTGAAPVVASVARELDILTVGIVTMPFSCEGKRRQQQALDGIAELRKHVDTLLVISNDKLRDEYGDMKLTQAFKKADDVLKTAAKGIAEIITVTGYVNVDFQDVNTVMRDSGKAIMGSGYAEGEDRAIRAVEEAVHSPLLDDSDIKGAKNILIYITSGNDEVSLDEVMEITEYVQEATGNCSEVIWGNGEDASLGAGINVTLIATGFNEKDEKYYGSSETYDCNAKVHVMYDDATKPKNRPIEEPVQQKTEPVQVAEPAPEPEIKVIDKRKPEETVTFESKEKDKKIHVLGDDDNIGNNSNGYTPTRNTSSERNINTPNPTPTTRVYNNPFNNNDDDEDFGITSYVKDSADTQTLVRHKVKTEQEKDDISQQEMLRRQRLASLNMNFKSIEHIEELETQPAYKRMGLNIFNKEEQQLSTYSSNKDKGLRESNSFLHDNVD